MSEPAAAAKDWSDVVKGAKRELLLRAARDEFAEQGLEGATMRGIAVRAGCTTGAIYPLFDSKEAIYAELLKQSLAALDAYVAEAAAKARTPDAQVEAACGAFLNYYLDHRDVGKATLGEQPGRGQKDLSAGVLGSRPDGTFGHRHGDDRTLIFLLHKQKTSVTIDSTSNGLITSLS